MKNYLWLFLIITSLVAFVPVKERNKIKNQKKQWITLFDGGSMDKWRSRTGNQFPELGWKVENGLLFLEGRGGDIISKEKFSNFELVFEFNYSPNANSGIKYF